MGVDPIHAGVLVGKTDVVPHDVDFGPRQGDTVRSVAGGIPSAGQHVVLGPILERRIVVPGVPARGVVGIEPAGLVSPGNIVLNEVPDAVLAAPHLEAVAISVCGPAGTVVGVPTAKGPRVFNGDRNLLVNQIIAIVRVPPRAAAPDDRGGTAGLVVNTEAVGILPVALGRSRIVVVVSIAIEDEVAPPSLRAHEYPIAHVVVHIQQLKDIVAAAHIKPVVGVRGLLEAAFLDPLEMQPVTRDRDTHAVAAA